MLTKIKSSFTGFFAKLILIVLTAAFVVVGFYGYNTRDINTIATVNGESINAREYSSMYQNILDNNRSSGPTTREQQDQYKQIALSSLINQKLLLEKLNELYLTAGDMEIAEYIVSLPSFRTDQRFDKKKLDEFIIYQNYSMEEFEKSVRRQLSFVNLSKFVSDTFQTNPQKVAEVLLKIGNTSYEIRALEFNKDIVKKSPPRKTNKELEAYYNSNKQNYVSEMAFDLKIVRYDRQDVIQTIQISDSEARGVFEQQKEMFKQPAGYQISRIYFPKNVKGSKYRSGIILKTLKQYPFNFEKYIRKYSKDEAYKATKGVMPFMPYGARPEYDDVVKNLKVGEFSKKVIETQDAYVLIKLLELRDGVIPEYDNMAPYIKEQLKYTEAGRRLKSFGESKKSEILKELETNTNFDEVFEKKNKQIYDQKNFTSNTQLANKDNARTLYYAMLEKEAGYTGMHTFDDDTFVFYKIVNIHPSVQLTFKEVKDQIKEEFKERFYTENVDKLYAQYAASVTDKLTFEAMVKELKAKKAVLKTSFTPGGSVINKIGVSQKLKDAVKALNQPSIGKAVAVEDDSRKFITVLDDIKPYNVSKDSKEFKSITGSIKKQLDQMYLADIESRLVAFKRAQADISYNDTALYQLDIAVTR